MTALGCGASPLYLGADLPASELVRAVEMTGARAIALGIVGVEVRAGEEAVAELRRDLPQEVELWVGGPAASGMALPPGVERIDSMSQIERRLAPRRSCPRRWGERLVSGGGVRHCNHVPPLGPRPIRQSRPIAFARRGEKSHRFRRFACSPPIDQAAPVC